MSVVTVQLGQCGNQMGFHFFDSLAKIVQEVAIHSNTPSKHYKGIPNKTSEQFVAYTKEKFFHEWFKGSKSSEYPPMKAKAVLIDMETKVIDHVINEAANNKMCGWSYDERRVFSRKLGSGNNWANGFLNYGAQCKDEIIDVIRKEIEACDLFGGFLFLMSLAGGTGSGLGTATATMVQDDFGGISGKTTVCQAVWPQSTGEVILQNYNTLLSVAHLSQVSDAVVLHFNDVLHHICKKRLNLPKVSFDTMNKLMAHHLSSVLAPAWPITTRSLQADLPWSKCHPQNSLTDIVAHLTPHPAYRLLQSFSVPIMAPNCLEYSNDHWQSLMKRLRQMLITNVAVDEGLNWHIDYLKQNRSISNLTFFRGLEMDFFEMSKCNIDMVPNEASTLQMLQSENLYAPWVPKTDRFKALVSPFRHGGYEKSVTLISNSSAIWQPLDITTLKSWKRFSAKAFLHQYESFGLLQENFLDCFSTVEQIINNYKEI